MALKPRSHAGRLASMSRSSGSGGRAANHRPTPQVSIATQRNDSRQPASATSVGLIASTISHASAKALAGRTVRLRIMPPQTSTTMTAARVAGGRRPVRAAYPTRTIATTHAPRFRGMPARRNVSHRKPARMSRCCPEMARAWITPVRIYLSHSAWAIADPSPSNRAAATPDRSGGNTVSNVRRPQPRTAASQPTGASAHPSASRTMPADVLWMLNSAVMRPSR
jgi:hypothetical protein